MGRISPLPNHSMPGDVRGFPGDVRGFPGRWEWSPQCPREVGDTDPRKGHGEPSGEIPVEPHPIPSSPSSRGIWGAWAPWGHPRKDFFCWKKELGLGVGPTGELQTSGSVEVDSGKAPEPLPGCSGFIGRPRPLPRAPAAFLGLTISRHPRLGMGQGWGMGWERPCSSRCPPMEIPRIFRDGRTHWGLGNPGVFWGAGTKPPPRHPEPGFREN